MPPVPVIARLLRWPWPYHLVRLALALVFIYAGAVKLMDVNAFAVVIGRYGMVPQSWLGPVALGLPALELLAGLGLAWDVRGSLSAVSAMLVLFALVLWFGALQGLDIDCGCFSGAELAEHDSLRQALYRDLLMLAGAVFLYWWRFRQRPETARKRWRYSFYPS